MSEKEKYVVEKNVELDLLAICLNSYDAEGYDLYDHYVVDNISNSVMQRKVFFHLIFRLKEVNNWSPLENLKKGGEEIVTVSGTVRNSGLESVLRDGESFI